ncbi:MAG: cryptochrome/photolyase family protein [Gammaproteobacteria bacterium]|nr:cryptochrome/photolyase family protein [Gammaproteobacteria bacterium]
MTTRTLRLILGDQLNAAHSWYQQKDPNVLYVIAELHQEAAYVKHHIQKLAAFFLAIQSFATALEKAGHRVAHLTLDDTQPSQDLPELLESLCAEHGVAQLEYQRPDEYRLQQQLGQLEISGVEIIRVESEHFMLPFDDIAEHFGAGKGSRMETFYRKMRQRFNILMESGEPLGGQWNFDADNRNKLKKDDLAAIPAPLLFENDPIEVLHRIDQHDVKHFGDIGERLLWPVTRQQSRQLLDFFCVECLPLFGRFQDSMTAKAEHNWSLYHARISFSMNAKMLHPSEVIERAVKEFESRPDEIGVAQIEGFVRQILGWREFVRGIYWVNMPNYENLNSLNAERDLPEYFWNGDTNMRCMQHALGQSLDYAYAHHIQRLMVIGNFCLLTGIDPAQVDQWYLGVYIDAIEWVEMPNTRGMSQFADGGLLASKPYSASGAYINRMSDYCGGCHYKVKEKVGDDACPFNSLYWHFMDRHRAQFGNNPRIGMVYRNLDKMDDDLKQATLARADDILADLDGL